MKNLQNRLLKHILKSFIFIYSALFFSGCATVTFKPVTKTQTAIDGIYHRVEKGQTLWKISKMYNIDLDELKRINRITDTTNIEVNQMIFIRQRAKQEIAGNAVRMEDFSWPLKGKIITAFGQTFDNMVNNGINISAHGDSSVVAARSGRVIFCSERFLSFGKTIIIDHGDGFSSLYTGNSKIFVKTGDSVDKGMTIAKLSGTGKDKNTYLHFEIRKGFLPQNPNFYLPLRTEKN